MECKICGHISKNKRGRNSHIRYKHKEISVGEYYEKYYPNYCIVCNNLIKFKGEKYEQYQFCSKKCQISKFKEHTPSNKGNFLHTEQELLQELKDLHKKYDGYVTQSLMRTNGKYNFQDYHKRFGSWYNACKLAEVPCLKQVTSQFDKDKYNSHLTVIKDTREQKGYNFENFKIKTLNVGDYALEDYEEDLVLERKGLGDLKCTFSGKNITRFKKELDRARQKEIYVIILVDSSIKEFFSSRKYGKMSNKSIYHMIKETCSQYADVCQILFSGSKKNSNFFVSWLLITDKEYIKGIDLQNEYDNKEGIFSVEHFPYGQDEKKVPKDFNYKSL